MIASRASRSVAQSLNVCQKRQFSVQLPGRVGVIGSGQMGTGIAYVAASKAALPVTLVDRSAAQLKSSEAFIDKLLAKDQSKGKFTADQVAEIKSRFSFQSNVDSLLASKAPFVIEAATENLDIKKSIFQSLISGDIPLGADAVLASNTSSISITKIAASAGQHADKVIGMHFMNPVPVMTLVEIIPGLQTSEATLNATLRLSEAMGKTVTQSKDMPGFVANRVLMPYINEAVYVLMEGTASREHIDTCMKLGTNVPMGPLTLADFIGLDTCLAIMKTLHDGLGDTKYRPCPLLQQYVDAGYYGKKSGRGFYEYNKK